MKTEFKQKCIVQNGVSHIDVNKYQNVLILISLIFSLKTGQCEKSLAYTSVRLDIISLKSQ